VQKYIDEKKLILLLDIDNTILHASNTQVNSDEYEELKKNYGDYFAGLKLSNHRMNVKLRPGLKEFFEAIKDKYQVYLYTYGTRDYAIEIIRYINKTFDYNYLDPDKLVAREDNTFDHKTIKRIFPTMEDMVIIMDDRTDVWQRSSHLINMVPYFFFWDPGFHINSKYIKFDEDRMLYSVSKLLVFINDIFYYYYFTYNSRLNVKYILEKKLKSVFNKSIFTFSNLHKKSQDIYKTSQCFCIETLGGVLEDDYTDDLNYIITKKYVSNLLII
jgi:FCP1-like phosphatase family protein